MPYIAKWPSTSARPARDITIGAIALTCLNAELSFRDCRIGISSIRIRVYVPTRRREASIASPTESAMTIQDAGGTATKTAPFLAPAGLNPLFAYMASDAGAMSSMRTYSVARAEADQRLEKMEPNPNSANGDRTQRMMR